MTCFTWRRTQWTISSSIKDVMLVIFVLELTTSIEYSQAVFILPEERTTRLGCISDGTTVNYECTVMDSLGIGSTTWRGNAFSCSGSPPNAINLLHSEYVHVPGANATCGDLSGMSVGVDGNNYTSRLTVAANTGLNGTMINCTVSGVLLEGFDTIRVGVIPPAPGPIKITFSNSGPPSSFTVSWSPPSSPVVGGISGYMFGVTGDCGDCMNMTVSADTLSVNCSGWTANDQTCTFEVRTLTQDCGFTSDTSSITLSVPPSPTDLSLKPHYNVNGNVKYVDVGFTGVDAPTNYLSNISYFVLFAKSSTSLNFTTATCNSTNNCTLRVNGSDLSPSDTYTVSVVASNIVGSGTAAVFLNTVAASIMPETFVGVVVNVSAATVSCNLLSSYTDTPNAVCTISYGPSSNCDMYMDSSTPATLTISLSGTLQPITEYCYVVTVNNGYLVFDINGTFRLTCDPEVLGAVVDPSSPNGPGMVTVPNGTVNYEGLTPGFTAQLMCDDGFVPGRDSSDRMCMSDGMWSDGNQICVKTPPQPCDMYCNIGIAVGVAVMVLIVVCLIIIITAIKCCDKGCRSGSFKAKQNSIIVEQHDLIPETFALQPSLPPELPPPLYADPEDVIQSHNIDRHAMVNRSKRKVRQSEEDISPYEEPQIKGPTIINESLDLEDKRGTDNLVDQQNEGRTYATIDVSTASGFCKKTPKNKDCQEPCVEYATINHPS